MNRRFGATSLQKLIAVIIVLAVVAAIFALARLDVTGRKGSGLSNQYVYDVKDLAEIDPNLILYQQARSPINTGFANAHGITVNSEDTIYVAGDTAIRAFSDDGDLLNEIELADMPRCLAVADDGKIYVGMKDHVEVYDGQGKQIASWQSLGADAVLTSIAVSKGNVFAADAGNRIVLRYDTAGKLINRIGEKDEQRNIPGFVIPSPYFDLAVARDGLLRVTDPGRHRIEAYTVDGDLELWWGQFSSDISGFCGCCNPVSFAILEDDRFVTCEKGFARVKIYDPDGTFVGVVAGAEQLLEGGTSQISEFGAGSGAGAFDVAVDNRGRILVLDTIKNVVRIFTKKKSE
jgi:hypothetical protein